MPEHYSLDSSADLLAGFRSFGPTPTVANSAARHFVGESVAADSYFDLLAKATHARRLMEHLRSPADLAAMTKYAQELEAKAEALFCQEFTSIGSAAWSDLQAQKQPEKDPSDKK